MPVGATDSGAEGLGSPPKPTERLNSRIAESAERQAAPRHDDQYTYIRKEMRLADDFHGSEVSLGCFAPFPLETSDATKQDILTTANWRPYWTA